MPKACGKANVVVGSRVPFTEARNTRRGPGYVSGDAEVEVLLEHPNENITSGLKSE